MKTIKALKIYEIVESTLRVRNLDHLRMTMTFSRLAKTPTIIKNVI